MRLQFIKDAKRGAFVLCKTSNPSSAELQTLKLSSSQQQHNGIQETLYEQIAALAQTEWNSKHNVGLVVGATDTEALTKARKAAPDLWILAPGEETRLSFSVHVFVKSEDTCVDKAQD